MPSGSSPSSSSSPTQRAGFATAVRSSRSPRRSWVLHGRAIAPMRQHASRPAPTRSGCRPASSRRRRARRRGRRSAPGEPRRHRDSSPKCQTRRSPSREIASSAGFDAGKRSSRSSIRFTATAVCRCDPWPAAPPDRVPRQPCPRRRQRADHRRPGHRLRAAPSAPTTASRVLDCAEALRRDMRVVHEDERSILFCDREPIRWEAPTASGGSPGSRASLWRDGVVELGAGRDPRRLRPGDRAAAGGWCTARSPGSPGSTGSTIAARPTSPPGSTRWSRARRARCRSTGTRGRRR